MSVKPWFRFFSQDWRGDQGLRLCSLAARGLWIEMLSIMHFATPRGYLLVSDLAPTDEQLAVLLGAPPDQITELIRELKSAGVLSKTRKGVIYSRRMVRDTKKANISRKNGSQGGNPTLCNKRENPDWDNPPDKPPDKRNIPDTRYHNKKNKQKKPDADDQGFESFRLAYPRRKTSGGMTKGSKQLAERAWSKLSEPDRLKAVSGLQAYKCAQPDGSEYVKDAVRYLRGRGWEDYEPAVQPENADLTQLYGRAAIAKAREEGRRL